MKSFCETIRKLRLEKGLPLRKVAPYLDIDQADLSRMEKGDRNATREQVIRLAEFFKTDEKKLLVLWLSDKVVYEIGDEEMGLKALRVAEEKVKYNRIEKK